MLAEGFVDEGPVLQRLRIKPVRVRDGVRLGLTWQYDTRDRTDCLDGDETIAQVDRLLGSCMGSALLETTEQVIELGFSKRGRPLIRSRRIRSETTSSPGDGNAASASASASAAEVAGAGMGRDTAADQEAEALVAGAGPDVAGGVAARESAGVRVNATAAGAGSGLRPIAGSARAGKQGTLSASEQRGGALADDDWAHVEDHNRDRQHLIRMDRPFLRDLGIVQPSGKLVPAMARKWRQINKFVEILVSAWRNSPDSERLGGKDQPPIRIRDFGAGKGYLTFALHDYLTHSLGLRVETVGVERRSDLVALCNRIARKLGMEGLRFEQGDIAAAEASGTDWMIALHACDTATDDALHQGVRQRASMLVCSPCCHRELRPQLLSPHPLQPILRHGIHKGQEAEMLTDGLRALLLEAEGYETRVFEFIALEHTSKNKMILATRAARPRPAAEVHAEVDALKSFYGIRAQRLDRLLRRKPEATLFPSVEGDRRSGNEKPETEAR